MEGSMFECFFVQIIDSIEKLTQNVDVKGDFSSQLFRLMHVLVSLLQCSNRWCSTRRFPIRIVCIDR